MKVALCFIISYSHVLNKEQIWLDWIKPNKDIINVYFHYKNYNEIKSEWIKKHAIHPSFTVKTDYTHIVPAYLTLMSFASNHDNQNQWFCFLTDSCVPIISPLKFREIFLENYSKTIMNWRKAWWNVNFCNRANLKMLKEEYHLANDPWFIMKKEDAMSCIKYSIVNKNIYSIICNGDIANESIFSIMLYSLNKLKDVKTMVTHATDWSKMSSPTSPYVFKEGDKTELSFINDFLNKNQFTIFLRKVDPKFPDNILINFIENDNDLMYRQNKVRRLERKLMFHRFFNQIKRYGWFFLILSFLYFLLVFIIKGYI
jgi:Core-2/I-Branching enzyme